MARILGIETSCDETAAAVFDTDVNAITASTLFSQIEMHKAYGGVVPEIASRSHLQKIAPIVETALQEAGCSLDELDAIAVTSKPGLAGSLLVGFSFAKALSWSLNIPLICVNHLEGHVFSSFLETDGKQRTHIPFPHLCLTASGGHSSVYEVTDFCTFETIATTLDDAAGEAFDKIGKLIGLGYPGGPIIEKYAEKAGFKDFFNYPRNKYKPGRHAFSFSGLKTAILYDLAKRGHIDLSTGKRTATLTQEVQEQVSSSLLVCVGDIFVQMLTRLLKEKPDMRAVTFVGGVACNKYLRARLQGLCDRRKITLVIAPPRFCTDYGAMIAFVGSYRFSRGEHASIDTDIF
jgi:N6-L-threonylcarbamoyladenine synthase